MNRKIIGTALFFVLLISYLYFAYARIYNTIAEVGLRSPNTEQVYVLGDQAKDPITYFALGDSLTAGTGVDSYEESYPYIFAQYLTTGGRHVILKSAAVGGARTDGVIREQLAQAVNAQPQIVTILIGTNDIHGLVSAREFRKNYETILDALERQTQAEIYLVSIPYIGTRDLILPPYGWYFKWRTQRFNAIVRDLAGERGLAYLDLYGPTSSDYKMPEYFSVDKFHPSAAEYKRWAAFLYEAFNR